MFLRQLWLILRSFFHFYLKFNLLITFDHDVHVIYLLPSTGQLSATFRTERLVKCEMY